MHNNAMNGAPERIRTSDPQIRSLAGIFEKASFPCKPGYSAATETKGRSRPSANRNRRRTAQEKAVPAATENGFGSAHHNVYTTDIKTERTSCAIGVIVDGIVVALVGSPEAARAYLRGAR